MAERAGSVLSTFETVTRGLDPAYSYMIFEKSSGRGEESDFREVVDFLDRLGVRIHSKDFLPDEERKKLLLVVRFDPGRTDEVLQELVRAGLPREVNVYAYGSPVAE